MRPQSLMHAACVLGLIQLNRRVTRSHDALLDHVLSTVCDGEFSRSFTTNLTPLRPVLNRGSRILYGTNLAVNLRLNRGSVILYGTNLAVI